MTVEELEAKATERRNVLVGIRIDSHSRELLSWAIAKVAEPGDCVVAVHVCGSSGHALRDKPLLDSYLEVYDGLCSMKKVGLSGQIAKGISVRRTLVREAKNYAAVAVIVGISSQAALRVWASTAKYCAKRLRPTTDIMAIHNGKIVFRRCNNNQLPGLGGDPKPSFNINENLSFREIQSEFGDSEAYTEISSFELLSRDEIGEIKDEVCSTVNARNKRSNSLFSGDFLDQIPGWPLLRRASSAIPLNLHSRKLSVVQWAMSLPDRSSQQDPRVSIAEEREISNILEDSNRSRSSASGELENGSDILLKVSSPSFLSGICNKVLKGATSNFHSENLIGKGGCSSVYKGILPDGKPVAVKVQKSSQKAMKDFALEVEIISSLNHKHITPLVDACIKDADLIYVYDFLSKGSLEENLHGKSKDKSPLSWELRFDIAVKIAEALNYLHNECSRPVIHRDVKSSNILLSDGFEPQLSDFGLAIWGPATTSFVTLGDVVGTFGYLAPEFFMYGKVSDKIDVYAFGVVLLELLSGRKPISSENKSQESLVLWAKPIIESGNAIGLVDPNLKGNFDEVQMQRMVLAAAHCITRAARLRPKMNEILKLLRGDKEPEKWVNPQNKDLQDPENQDNDDEVYPNSSAESHLSLALLDVDYDSTSFSSWEHGNNLSIEEYFKDRWSRSSSFN
ncbi:protein kinase STUNTED-like isoform X1 [Populus nigra]|uniref:protein kinase STUNTED-like isoform X1 n=2 Tax=Populus nigra TaxID=3691 RepID=UPI002B2742F3|nr:protein kinase STUNTED-like isoform X1 [Populus nigra]XP_061958204.1 protein kinase STUNTED-like isoform X1 [Populus nigra]